MSHPDAPIAAARSTVPPPRAPVTPGMSTTVAGPGPHLAGPEPHLAGPGAPQAGPAPTGPAWPPPAGMPTGSGPAPPIATRPARRGPLVFLAGFATGLAVLGLAWIITATAGPGSFTMTGSLTLASGATGYPSPGCHGYGGYDDIDTGATVVVYDEKGTVVATGALGQGATSGYGGCEFPVSVTGVPGGSQYYQVEVTHRGKVTFGADAARNGRVALTLGT